jgi:hypothetical protein
MLQLQYEHAQLAAQRAQLAAAALSPASIAAATSSTVASVPARSIASAVATVPSDESSEEQHVDAEGSVASDTVVVQSSSSSRASHSDSSSSAASSSSSSSSVGDAWKRSLVLAKSLSRLRSSLLSAYAVYRWAIGGSSAHHGEPGSFVGAGFLTPVELIAPQATAAASGMTSVASSSALQSLTRNYSVSSVFSSLFVFQKKHGLWHTLRYLLRALLWLARTYSRRFHRLLRPHLVLLLRSRAMSRLVGLAFPFLRRNLLLASHVAFVYGSAVILLRRALPHLDGQLAGVDLGLLHPLRQAVSFLLVRWRALSRPQKLLLLFAQASSMFVLFTCVQITREYRRKQAQRRAALQARAEDALQALAAGEPAPGWSADQIRAALLLHDLDASSASASNQPHHLLLHSAFHSPEATPIPSPDPSPPQSPALSAAPSTHDLLTLQSTSSHAESDDDSTAVARRSLSPGRHHQSSPSFHRECAACVAGVIASSAVAAAYQHNHPVHGDTPAATVHDQWELPHGYLAALEPTESAFSSTDALEPAMRMHPLANTIAKRMEWSPGAAPAAMNIGGGATSAASVSASTTASSMMLVRRGSGPGTPLQSAASASAPAVSVLSSSLSFVSPASQRLTHIKLSQLRRHESNAEALLGSDALQHLQLARWHEQQALVQQQEAAAAALMGHPRQDTAAGGASIEHDDGAASAAASGHASPSDPDDSEEDELQQQHEEEELSRRQHVLRQQAAAEQEEDAPRSPTSRSRFSLPAAVRNLFQR